MGVPSTAAAETRGADPGGDYGALRYPSMPIPHTQPAHLAALAALFGMDAPPADRARVLELGCASGGNIVPLAARFPCARFTGIDLCRRHVEDGRLRIARLGLDNVALHQGDLADFPTEGEQFDYVICHGVFSWVPKRVQMAVFRICAAVLAPEGVATISYNALPGWHLRRVVRDVCLRYAGRDGTPWRRVAKARAALERLAGGAGAASAAGPYGSLLRAEAARLRGMPSAYILGEFLSPDNDPWHVADFIAQAERCGLDHLCEADLLASLPPALRARGGESLASPDAGERAAFEQDADFLTGRPFRRAVLVRQGARRGPPDPARLARLHLSAAPRLAALLHGSGAAPDRDAATDHAVRHSLARLAAAHPATLAPPDLLPEAVVGDAIARAAVEARIASALFDRVLAGEVGASALPLRPGTAALERPRLWPIAQVEAASGQPWMTSLRHDGVPVTPVLKALLPCLDGRHDRAALRDRLAAAFRSGEVRPPEPPAAARSGPAAQAICASSAERGVESALAHLQRRALLAPAPTTG